MKKILLSLIVLISFAAQAQKNHEGNYEYDSLVTSTVSTGDSSNRAASTAWVKRQGFGTGSVSTPTLQQVTTAGATTTDIISTGIHHWYYSGTRIGSLTAKVVGGTNYGGIIYMKSPKTTVQQGIVPQDSLTGTDKVNYLPNTGHGTDTLATLYDLRNAGTGSVANGTYTATLSNVTNISSSSAISDFTYSQVGNVVTFSGAVSITASSNSATTTLEVTLPVASGFTSAGDLSGTANSDAVFGYVYANTTNGKAAISFKSPASGAVGSVRFICQYKVTPP